MNNAGTSRVGFSRWWGAACGLLAAVVAMGVGQLFAGLTYPAASPVVAVGEAAIDRTPLAVKDWATSTFGTDDKTVLLGGVLIVVLLYCAVMGALAIRWFAVGAGGMAAFGAIGLWAALTRHGASESYAVPTLFATLAAIGALRWLVLAARRSARGSAALRAIRAKQSPDRLPDIGFAPDNANPVSESSENESSEAEDKPPWDDLSKPADGDDDKRTGWVAAPGRAWGGETGGFRPPTEPTGPAARPVGSGLLAAQQDLSAGRRQFLLAAGASVAVAAVGAVAGRTLSTSKNVSLAEQSLKLPRATYPAAPLPRGVNLNVPGISSFITPNNQFYRVDTALIVPQVDPSNWQLRIHGMVDREITLTFDDLLHRPLLEDYITLCCVSNPVDGPYIGDAKWLGASLSALLREARPQAGADQLLATSTDGFTSGTPLDIAMDTGRDSLVAVGMNGTALPTEHGFPARLVVPGLYGYVSACKWVVDLEVTKFADAQGYWVPRGWSAMGPIKTESRIDVPAGGASPKAGKVPVAGVAWAQHKGIEAVEVRVDGGIWHEATLGAVPGIDTWQQWVWEWDATPGTHLIEARATDKTGYTQTAAQAQVAPNGATGYPFSQVTVVSA
jgi:DMSO/TMAO reductase YedYZ molybdopterin-dependent catalytic subunit